MISLHVTIYTLDEDEGDRFKVMATVEGSDDLVDVTDQYEVVAIATDDERGGFAVLKLAPAVIRHAWVGPNDDELEGG